MQYVEVKVHDNVATILLDRASVANALNPQLLEDLATAFSDVHQEKRVQAVVLAASGKHFCSGMDMKVLSEIAEMPEANAQQEWFSLWQRLTELLEQMLRFPKPVVAAIDGGAIGAGFGLALACDIIVPTTQAYFSAVAVRRGLVGGATSALLSFRCGGAIAARMLLTGLPVKPDEANQLGLCLPAVSDDQIWVRAKEIANQCTMAPREAVQATKRMLNESIGETLLSQLSIGAANSATACTTESAAEGIKSFLENRDPKWP